MSKPTRKLRITDLKAMKARGERITMLTAYDATMARLLDHAGIDVLLVGDSLGMVIEGHDTTLPVTLEAMVHHTAAVCRGAARALVVADMPFLTYQTGVDEAMRNAGTLLKNTGASAVKLEGGRAISDVVRRLVSMGIPAMGHLGLMPQAVHQLGGFCKQARSSEAADLLHEEARELEQAGAFALVLESIPAAVAQSITRELRIPTLGIGAGPFCDGQVLVSYDMLGLTAASAPPFAKKYANLAETVVDAAAAYAEEVRGGIFPELRAPVSNPLAIRPSGKSADSRSPEGVVADSARRAPEGVGSNAPKVSA